MNVPGKKIIEGKTALVILAAFTILVSWRNSDGEDITVARNTFNSIHRNNFLGATGAFYYGNIPNSILTWSHYLLLVQVSLTVIGLILIQHNLLAESSPVGKILFTGLAYLVLNFSAAYSRDATMTGYIILGFGLLTIDLSAITTNRKRYFRAFGWLSLIVGFLFRPWLSVVLIFILMFTRIRNKSLVEIKASKFFTVIACLFLALAPSVIDKVIVKATNMQESYPEQIVMIHDLVTTYCWSANNGTADIAKLGLEVIDTNPQALSTVCQFYKPNTWQAVVAQDPATPSSMNLETPIHPIQPGDSAKYNKLRHFWVHMIMTDPFTYIQNHMAFGNQVIISGDTRRLRAIGSFKSITNDMSVLNSLSFVADLYLLPLDLIISLHLLSPLFVFILWGVTITRRFLADKRVEELTTTLIFFGFFLFWNLMTVIAFASDNGRYTLIGSIFLLLSLIIPSVARPMPNTLGFKSNLKTLDHLN